MKSSLGPAQIRPLAVGGGLLLAAGVLGWLGLTALSERQLEAQALADRMGNPALAALLADGGAVPRAAKEAAEILKLEEDLRGRMGVMTKPWAQGTKEASGEGEDWGKDPGKWKDKLIETQSDLLKKSIPHNVKLSPDFYLGLEDYRQKSPTVEEVPALALHLSVARRLVEDLFEARKVKEQYPTTCELRTISGPGSAREKSSEASPRTPAATARPPTAGPVRKTFRMEIRGSPEVLYAYVQRLSSDPWLFIITDLTVANEKQAFPLRTEIAKKFSDPSPGAEKTEARLLEMLAGNETLDVQIVVDFVGWKNPEEAMAKSPTPPKP